MRRACRPKKAASFKWRLMYLRLSVWELLGINHCQVVECWKLQLCPNLFVVLLICSIVPHVLCVLYLSPPSPPFLLHQSETHLFLIRVCQCTVKFAALFMCTHASISLCKGLNVFLFFSVLVILCSQIFKQTFCRWLIIPGVWGKKKKKKMLPCIFPLAFYCPPQWVRVW